MAKIELRYVQAFKDRHGKLRHYFRHQGRRVPLPGLPGSPEFMAAYQSALGKRPNPVAAERAQPGSFGALIVAYYGSSQFTDLRASTQRAYRCTFDQIRTAHGDKPVARIERKHLLAMLDAKTPGARINWRKRLRQLLEFAVERGWRSDNPLNGVRTRRKRSEGFIPWSEEEIARYEARWPSGTRERLALALLLYTGQRRSDVVKMGRQHVRDGRISVAQLKTDARVRIPLHPRLAAELSHIPANQMSFLIAKGEPFTANGFGNWFRERVKAAEIERRAAHGLRKAAGRRMAEAGCTAKQIMAVLGHTTLEEAERYTRDADRGHLADAAYAKLHEAGT